VAAREGQGKAKEGGIKSMAQREISERRMERLKAAFGWTEEQIRSLSPSQWKYLDNARKFGQYKVIAEVVKAENCIYQPKIGDKFVFSAAGELLPNECTFPALCVFALAPIFVPYVYVIQDRICEGVDPCGLVLDHIKCLDAGVEGGGFGEVLFRIYCEKVAP